MLGFMAQSGKCFYWNAVCIYRHISGDFPNNISDYLYSCLMSILLWLCAGIVISSYTLNKSELVATRVSHYKKALAAFVVLYNPLFDNSKYRDVDSRFSLDLLLS